VWRLFEAEINCGKLKAGIRRFMNGVESIYVSHSLTCGGG